MADWDGDYAWLALNLYSRHKDYVTEAISRWKVEEALDFTLCTRLILYSLNWLGFPGITELARASHCFWIFVVHLLPHVQFPRKARLYDCLLCVCQLSTTQ
ncbi:hypothetical protein XELAEV_18029603mg [Xenopus laevis]|uniref:Uncharacterized protein n=1 Tax=Xenopus laevis TaxID=8355 RepID=A0A974CRZ7_XENLA|nr:hypothetical protein XELAEV_18029603mg [Xenopus laevis]